MAEVVDRFTSLGPPFILRGHEGQVFPVRNLVRMQRESLSAKYIGALVEIDGKVMQCIAVESHCLLVIREGDSIGLMCRPV